MTVMTPSQICEKLGIQASTLRKYSLLLEAEGVEFDRTANNSRRYTDIDLVTLQDFVTLTETHGMSVKDAAETAANRRLGSSSETPNNADAHNAPERHDADITPAVIAELQRLREVVKEQAETIEGFRKSQEQRDKLFLQALEELQGQIDTLQKSLPEPAAEEIAAEQEEEVTDKTAPDSDDVSVTDAITEPKPKKGFFARLFGR